MGNSLSLSQSNLKSKPFIVSIEGNIGSGKSTVFNNLQKYVEQTCVHSSGSGSSSGCGWIFVDEPTREWETVVDDEGIPILTNFYKDIKRYAFRFQMMVYITRLNNLLSARSNPNVKIIITERCLLTDANVFAKMLYDTEKIEHDEYLIYSKWVDEFSKYVEPSCIVYFKASSDVCMERIRKRNRTGESDICFEYLETCNKYHDDWLLSASSNKITTLVVNANVNESEYDYCGDIYTHIMNYVTDIHVGIIPPLRKYIHSSSSKPVIESENTRIHRKQKTRRTGLCLYSHFDI